MYDLAQLRQQRNWTRLEMAQRLGVHKNTVARWERGEMVPDPPVQRLIALTFGVGVDAIVYGKPAPPEDDR